MFESLSAPYARFPARARDIAKWLVVLFITAACALRVEAYNNPTLPAPGWHLYSDLDMGYAIALPLGWGPSTSTSKLT